MKCVLIPGIVISVLFASCGPRYFAPVQFNSYYYGMEAARQGEQTAMKEWLQPYSDSVNNSMNIVLGQLTDQLTKSWPECSLGHFMTDAYLERAEKKFGKKVDVALMNYGGIRLGTMEPGPITKGELYELMPFDNLMVLLELDGNQLQQFLDHIASRNGWPVSGATYTLYNKKAKDVLVGGAVLVPGKKYIVATSDYVANGGDDNSALKGVEQRNIGYLQRDALIEYVMEHKVIKKPEGVRVLRLD